MQIVDGEPIVRESQHTSSSPSVSATMRALAQHVLPVGEPARPSLKTPSIATGASLQQWPYESSVCDGSAHNVAEESGTVQYALISSLLSRPVLALHDVE